MGSGVTPELCERHVRGAPEVFMGLEGRVVKQLQAEEPVAVIGRHVERELAPATVPPIEENELGRVLERAELPKMTQFWLGQGSYCNYIQISCLIFCFNLLIVFEKISLSGL